MMAGARTHTHKEHEKKGEEEERPFIARLAIAPAAILQIVSSKLLLLKSHNRDARPPSSTILS